jgi:serine/threonine protein kinase
MFFQNDDGTERWKLIDFDSASHVNGYDYVKFITNYSAPEVARAYRDKYKIRANFATDIFSFGLILYYIETGIFFFFFFFWSLIELRNKIRLFYD